MLGWSWSSAWSNHLVSFGTSEASGHTAFLLFTMSGRQSILCNHWQLLPGYWLQAASQARLFTFHASSSSWHITTSPHPGVIHDYLQYDPGTSQCCHRPPPQDTLSFSPASLLSRPHCESLSPGCSQPGVFLVRGPGLWPYTTSAHLPSEFVLATHSQPCSKSKSEPATLDSNSVLPQTTHCLLAQQYFQDWVSWYNWAGLYMTPRMPHYCLRQTNHCSKLVLERGVGQGGWVVSSVDTTIKISSLEEQLQHHTVSLLWYGIMWQKLICQRPTLAYTKLYPKTDKSRMLGASNGFWPGSSLQILGQHNMYAPVYCWLPAPPGQVCIYTLWHWVICQAVLRTCHEQVWAVSVEPNRACLQDLSKQWQHLDLFSLAELLHPLRTCLSTVAFSLLPENNSLGEVMAAGRPHPTFHGVSECTGRRAI